MFVGSFIALNLFVGAIVDNFCRIKGEQDGTATMTPAQQQWVSSMKATPSVHTSVHTSVHSSVHTSAHTSVHTSAHTSVHPSFTPQAMSSMKPMAIQRPPTRRIPRLAYSLVTSQPFDSFIMGVIVVNILTMACDYWDIERDLTSYTLYTNAMLTFNYIYYTECVLKLTGLGGGYFKDNWCRFDFFLVCTSAVDQFATEILQAILPMPPMIFRVLRIFRILRILRLLKGAKVRARSVSTQREHTA